MKYSFHNLRTGEVSDFDYETIACNVAHDQLRGWYDRILYWDGVQYSEIPNRGFLVEIHYMRDSDIVGKIIEKRTTPFLK